MKESSKAKETILVLGVGNEALGDEGFGIYVARRMKDVSLPENVRVQEGGVAGLDLLGSITDIDRLIVVDAMMTDLEPGNIGYFELDDRINAPNKTNFSFHQLGIAEILQIASLMGHKPRVEFVVAKPELLKLGFEMSEAMHKAVDKTVDYLTEKLVGNVPVKG